MGQKENAGQKGARAAATLDAATARLVALGAGAGLVSARWLVEVTLDEDGLALLNEPALGCDCRRWGITAPQVRARQGCVCRQSALALRLWDRAFPDAPPGLTTDARKRRFRRKCPGCRIPFVTGEKAQLYCNGCTTHGKGAVT